MPDAAAVMAKAPAENFTVASRLLPRASRQHLLAIYGFARLVDDVGDEAELDVDRAAALDWLDAELDRAAAGAAQPSVCSSGSRRRSATAGCRSIPSAG